MREHHNEAYICQKANAGLEYAVCKIEYRIREDGDFSYTFIPNYSVISLLNDRDFQGIPGLDLDLKMPAYHRDNMVPVYISERVPSKHREDYGEILESYGMKYMEPIDFLLKAGDAYFGDDFYLQPYEEKKRVVLGKIIGKSNIYGMIKIALDHIARGDDIVIGDVEVNDANRLEVHNLLLTFYLKAVETQRSQKKKNEKAGRPRVLLDRLRFGDMEDKVRRKELTIEEASKKLGISVSTYFRLRSRYKDS